MAHLRGLSGLTELYLTGTRISDAALVHLDGFSQLWRLDLGHRSVGDATLSVLSMMARLDQLSIDDIRITSACIQDF